MFPILAAGLLCGCQSTPDYGTVSTVSRSYEVTATYQLEIRDETGQVVHRTGSSKVSTVEHDEARMFSAHAAGLP